MDPAEPRAGSARVREGTLDDVLVHPGACSPVASQPAAVSIGAVIGDTREQREVAVGDTFSELW